MAKFIYGMNQSLDGYIDHTAFRPSPALFTHWTNRLREITGSLYGRTMYETMRYWDTDQPDWTPAQHEYAALWRRQPKWVVSRTLKSAGPNATLIETDIEPTIRALKSRHAGEIAVAGPTLAASLSALNLIDEYRLYLHPVVIGQGKPYFAAPRPPLHLSATDQITEQIIRLTYVPPP
jgi:dihydrofolate reductase